jgi:hypothetical protein
MKVSTRNTERRIAEMTQMWYWMTNTYGPPEAHNDNMKRWTYGKDSPGFMGSSLIDGTWDIEWIEFRDDKDATMFMMRWP